MHFTHRSKKCLLGHCDGLIVKQLRAIPLWDIEPVRINKENWDRNEHERKL